MIDSSPARHNAAQTSARARALPGPARPINCRQAVCDGRPVFGLPGQPVYALNTFELFVAPLLRALLGQPGEPHPVRARLTQPLRSADGREDHVRVTLQDRDGSLWAEPIAGSSAMISTMVRADGITVVPAGSGGFAAGDEVDVRLIG